MCDDSRSARAPDARRLSHFFNEAIARRHTAVRSALRDQQLQGMVLYGAGRFNSDIQYLSNWPGRREGYVVLPLEADPTLLVQLFNHAPMAECRSLISDTRWAGADSVATLAEVIRTSIGDSARVAVAGGLPFSQYARLAELLPAATLVDWNRELRRLRLMRDAEELAFFHVAAELTDRSIDRLAERLRAGLRESELPALVKDHAWRRAATLASTS